jgi:hypothetical protein
MNETQVKTGGVRINMSESGEAHADIVCKGFPLNPWTAWDKDCEENYHGIRWLKMWSDHLIAKDKLRERDEVVNEVLDKVNFELDQAQQTIQKEDEEDGVSVLSGNA